MKLEEIQTLWSEDCVIDKSDLSYESLSVTPKLHSKYYNIFLQELKLLRQIKAQYKTLYLEKYEFFTQGPTHDQHKNGWTMPSKGIILKNEVEKYLEADKDMINMSLKVELQKDKVDYVQSIINEINRRSFHIKNALEFLKFTNGG